MAFMEITPPPEDLQKWHDELYADLPDLPDASEDSLTSKYDLRIAVRENNNFPITYLDQDESGTFDPACKKPPECVSISRKKREKRERIEYGTPKKLKTNTWQGGRWIGRQLPVVFTFASEMGRAALKDYGTSLDNWPERLPDPDSSDDSPTDWPDLSAQSYGLRERRRCDLSDPANAAGDDDLHLEDITLGYPAYRGCKGCFEWGFRCPLLDEGSRYPCAECAADNAECELIVDPAVKRTSVCQCFSEMRSGTGKEKEHEIFSYKRSQPVAAEPTKSNRCRTITTHLAHPIQFNYAYDDDEKTAPCHWCEDAIYGILGLGKIEVEIIDNEDGQGFIEIVGGHTGTYGHSRMCEFCTTDRLKITACQSHEIQPIEGMDPGKFDYKAVTEWMMPGMASLAPFAWCSICPSPAFFFCSTKPDIEVDGHGEDSYLGDQKGCGLLLCESCVVTLVGEHQGNLDSLIDSLEHDGDDEGFGIRADASFLHPKGELLRRMGGFSSPFLANPMTHIYDDVGPPALTKSGNPAPKVDKMGDFMALNGHWDNQDDDEPGMFKEDELKD
ncbi:MAG: hypothetical protein ASARMPRED_009413 [Alectoria sarmentosa]|nr:MAG: hypothetical protein ASARMPRED_009413 [Alectoria sarmentosa]